MSIWIFIIGGLISLNCLLAWSSSSHGAKCLAMWLGSSYGIGLAITLAGRFIPWAGLDFPWQNVIMGCADLALLGWLLGIIARNDDLKPIWKPLAFAQVSSLILHALDAATGHMFNGLYYGALDAIILAMIAINLFTSAQHGVSGAILFPRAAGSDRHRRGHG